MPTPYRTKTGDTVDLICWRIYGRTRGLTEAVFAANPALRNEPLILTPGLILSLPDVTANDTPPATIKLWD